jgi:hypothetical protein
MPLRRRPDSRASISSLPLDVSVLQPTFRFLSSKFHSAPVAPVAFCAIDASGDGVFCASGFSGFGAPRYVGEPLRT